ncbi:MAG: hypothetical protein MRY63_00300 [Neomegalonema sp.]|nr:hypothetical protein [Neomegalonema sp.]
MSDQDDPLADVLRAEVNALQDLSHRLAEIQASRPLDDENGTPLHVIQDRNLAMLEEMVAQSHSATLRRVEAWLAHAGPKPQGWATGYGGLRDLREARDDEKDGGSHG